LSEKRDDTGGQPGIIIEGLQETVVKHPDLPLRGKETTGREQYGILRSDYARAVCVQIAVEATLSL